jgi:hypothetical protein
LLADRVEEGADEFEFGVAYLVTEVAERALLVGLETGLDVAGPLHQDRERNAIRRRQPLEDRGRRFRHLASLELRQVAMVNASLLRDLTQPEALLFPQFAQPRAEALLAHRDLLPTFVLGILPEAEDAATAPVVVETSSMLVATLTSSPAADRETASRRFG